MQPDVLRLYDAFATGYDEAFESDPVRSGYDQLAWEMAVSVIPPSPALIVDAGCGSGRWVSRLLAAGYRVLAVEPAVGMNQVLLRKFAGTDKVRIMHCGFDDAPITPESVDAVLAIGSLQYAEDADASLRRMVQWVRPGGPVCVHVDSLLGVAIELIRLERLDEAAQCAESGWGVFRLGDETARLRLFERQTLSAMLERGGLQRIEVRGLLVRTTALGRSAGAAQLETGGLAVERRFSAVPALADSGKHLIAWGWRP